MENNQLQPRKKPKVKKVLTQGNKSLFTSYLKVNTYNPVTFLIAFTSAFLHALLRSYKSSLWINGDLSPDFILITTSFFFWLSMMLNVQRMVYGTRIDQIIFLISATIGTVVGTTIFK
jgi:hypothetical protein